LDWYFSTDYFALLPGASVRAVESTLIPRRPAALLAVSDAVAIIVFATIGLISHHHGLSVRGYARDALPIVGVWFAAGLGLRLYVTQRPSRLAATWLIGVTGGVLVRALILGRTLNGKEATFLAVALITIGVLVAALRGVIALTPFARRHLERPRPNDSG